MRRIFTTDAKKDEQGNATKTAALPDIETIYQKGVEEIVAGRLNIDVAVADVAKVYNLNAPDVKAEFEARIAKEKTAAPAPTSDADLQAKRDRAEKLVAAAEKAEKAAAKATEEAKAARMKADAAVADAENLVLVQVPTSFHLSIRRENGTIETHSIKAGTTKLPREQAEHGYAKANGVKVLGLPSEEKAAA